MKRAIIIILIIAAVGAGAGAYYLRRNSGEVQVNTSPITRGEIIDTVGSTGTLQAVTTVQVGSQVSGNISWLGADFNSIVRKDQVIARLDPSLSGIDRGRLDLEARFSYEKRIEKIATEQLHLVAPRHGQAIVIERVTLPAPPEKSVVASR